MILLAPACLISTSLFSPASILKSEIDSWRILSVAFTTTALLRKYVNKISIIYHCGGNHPISSIIGFCFLDNVLQTVVSINSNISMFSMVDFIKEFSDKILYGFVFAAEIHTYMALEANRGCLDTQSR